MQFLRADLRALGHIVSPGAVDEIRAWDVLEHMMRSDAVDVLKQMYTALEPGGIIEVKMPEIGALLRWSAKQQDMKAVSFRWYGQHATDKAWMYPQNVHMYVWAIADFVDTVCNLGYTVVTTEFTEETNIRVVLKKR